MESHPKSLRSYTPAELRQLYETDAARFAELAEDAIREACIGKTQEQTQKLRQLQWTIDMQLRKGKTSDQKMQIMENIFYSRVYGRNGALDRLISACASFTDTLSGFSPRASLSADTDKSGQER